MATLLILGAGQYGHVAREIAEAMGNYDTIEFLDDNSELAIGKLADFDKIEHEAVFVAIGNCAVRKYWIERIEKIAVLIHPRATIMPSAVIGEGSIVEAGAVVGSNAKIGKGVIVKANAVIGHDVTVGDYCHLKYNCSILERAVVPSETIVEYNVCFPVEK